MYKFYVCEFTNIKYPNPDPNKIFIKFGITHHMEVLNRFTSGIDDGYEKNYHDWLIRCKFSTVCKDKDHAERLERHWLEQVFPNPGPTKVWVEKYLGTEDNNKYSNNTGISELRLLTIKQAKWVYYNLHRMKETRSLDNGFNS